MENQRDSGGEGPQDPVPGPLQSFVQTLHLLVFTREEVAERHVGEDLVSSVLGTLAFALPPELLQSLQQGPRGTEEEGVLLGDGVVEGRVIAMAAQPLEGLLYCPPPSGRQRF